MQIDAELLAEVPGREAKLVTIQARISDHRSGYIKHRLLFHNKFVDKLPDFVQVSIVDRFGVHIGGLAATGACVLGGERLE